MAIQVNNHQFTGKVIYRAGPFAITNDMNKWYLYCQGIYLVGGKEREEECRFTCFSWGQQPSKVSNVFIGDVVSFYFNLTGKFKPEKKDNLGCPSCWTEAVVASKVEIVSSENRIPFNQKKTEDGLGTFEEPPTPKFKYEDGLKLDNLEDDPAVNDLPF